MFDYKTYDKPLYHGSKGGIIGDISVESPNKYRKSNPCDFGNGFYVGTNKTQAQGVCIEDKHPVLYTLKIDFNLIPDDKILILNDQQWLFTILSCRRKAKEFSCLKIAQDILNIVDSYDVVIGTIADDRMNLALNAFNDDMISDVGLGACLKYIDYGTQIVIKTQKVNDIVTILSEKDLVGFEAENVRKKMEYDRVKSKNVVDEMRIKYRREGQYLSEIVEQTKLGKITVKDIFPEYFQRQGIVVNQVIENMHRVNKSSSVFTSNIENRPRI